MKRFLDAVLRINTAMQAIAGIFLTFIMLLTTLDVIGRLFGKPVSGAVEIIAICGGVVVVRSFSCSPRECGAGNC